MGQQKDKKCDFVTHKTYNLKKHKECHVKFTQKLLETLKCSECDKTFTNKKTLGDHIRHTHNQKKITKNVILVLMNYMWYFEEMGTNFHDTNGEYVEAVHYSLEGHENTRKCKVSRNIGTDEYLRKAISNHTSFNSLRVGSPLRIMSVRKKQSNSPLAIHNK